MARPDKSAATDASTTVLESAVKEAAKTVIEYHKLTTSKLGDVDITTLEGEALLDWARAAHDRINDLTGSVYVEKRTGILYVGTRQVASVLRPLFKGPGRNPTSMIPSVLKTKDENYDSATKVTTIPKSDIIKGFEILDFNLLAAVRFQMARITGNGVNLVNQGTKDDAGVALALGNSKSGSV